MARRICGLANFVQPSAMLRKTDSLSNSRHFVTKKILQFKSVNKQDFRKNPLKDGIKGGTGNLINGDSK